MVIEDLYVLRWQGDEDKYYTGRGRFVEIGNLKNAIKGNKEQMKKERSILGDCYLWDICSLRSLKNDRR